MYDIAKLLKVSTVAVLKRVIKYAESIELFKEDKVDIVQIDEL